MNNDEQQQLERLFGGNPHLKATLEQTCDFDGKDQESAETQPVFRDKQSLLGNVVQRAQSLGTWIERIEDYVKEMIGNGQENDVFISLEPCFQVMLVSNCWNSGVRKKNDKSSSYNTRARASHRLFLYLSYPNN